MTWLVHGIYGAIIAGLLAWVGWLITDRNRAKKELNKERLVSNRAIYLGEKDKNRQLSGEELTAKCDAQRERIKSELAGLNVD